MAHKVIIETPDTNPDMNKPFISPMKMSEPMPINNLPKADAPPKTEIKDAALVDEREHIFIAN